MAIKEPPDPLLRETRFEERPGVARLSVERGFAQVHVSRIPDESRTAERLSVLQRIAEELVNVQLPKLTPSGASFLIAEAKAERVERALGTLDDHFSVRRGRSVLSVHAPGIREDDGLMARLVGILLASGIDVEHVADTHDRLVAVVDTASVDRLVALLEPIVNRQHRSIEPSRRKRRRRIKVLKFGGTSVATAEARTTAARKVIAAVEEGFSPVVVVSAIGRHGLPYATDTLIDLLQTVDPRSEPDPRDLDLMLACGEIFSAVLFARTLGAMGHGAQAFRGDQAGILTDAAFGRARIVAVRPGRIEQSLRAGLVPVVCGFQGCVGPREGVAAGEVTTLGRGGSDTTASALGAALGAEAVEIYTDVDGVMNADPRVIATATTLRRSTYEEVAAMAHLGAKVVHPRAAEIAMAYGIPLWVKNTFSTCEGTEIIPDARCPGRRKTGVAHTGKLVYLQFDLGAIPVDARRTVESRIYETLAAGGINVFMVNLSPTSTGFAVPNSAIGRAERLLSPLTTGDLPILMGQRPCSMVSLVGRDYVETPGTLRVALKALHDEGVAVLQTNAMDQSISFLVAEAETTRVIRALVHCQALLDDE